MRKAKFKNLIMEYKNLVYSQALYSTGNLDDAADITQEVLIKLWDNLDNIESQSAKSWLLKVTRNRCIDASRKKRELLFSEIEDDNGMSAIAKISTVSDTDPEQTLEKYETRQILINAIAELPVKIKDIVILRYIHDETYDVIAKTIGIPLNTVKVYLHRGRKFLAQKLIETLKE